MICLMKIPNMLIVVYTSGNMHTIAHSRPVKKVKPTIA